jgi:hypothetical protein
MVETLHRSILSRLIVNKSAEFSVVDIQRKVKHLKKSPPGSLPFAPQAASAYAYIYKFTSQ